MVFWVFSDRLVGRFYSYLLPERFLLDACNFKTLSQKISGMMGWETVYSVTQVVWHKVLLT